MPIAPGPVTHPPLQPQPHVVPQEHRVLPVEPARRVTGNRGAGRAGIDDRKRRRRNDQQQPDRGGVLDLEV